MGSASDGEAMAVSRAAFMDDSARRQRDTRAVKQEAMRPTFERRAVEIIDHAGRPENFEDCVGRHTLNTNDLVAEIKHKLFGESKQPRSLFTEHIVVDTCGCYTRDDLVKKAAKETLSLRDVAQELQQDVERLQESNSLKASTTESLKHSMAQLSYEWYAAKESAVKMQDNLLAVYENLAINMARKRRGDWLRRVFREWCYTAREIKVDALQEHFDMLQQQQANLCQLLADARQRAEVLEIYVSRRQVAAIKFRDRRLLWFCLYNWHIQAVSQVNEALHCKMSGTSAQLEELSGALERSRTQRSLADEEARLMKGAHSLIHEKLLAAQDRTAVVMVRLLDSNTMHSVIRRWRLAITEGAAGKVAAKARAHRTQLESTISEATQLAEHWKGQSDLYWEKMKACAGIIGRMRDVQALREAMAVWVEEVRAVRGEEYQERRAIAFDRHNSQSKAFQAWREGGSSMSQDRLREGLMVMKEDWHDFRKLAFGWAAAAAWAVTYADHLEMRLAFAKWRENAKVSYCCQVVDDETEARKKMEVEVAEFQHVAENSKKLKGVIEKWSRRRHTDVRAVVLRSYFERWHCNAASGAQGRALLEAMESDVRRSNTELMCALTELGELRLFKDGIATSAGTQQFIVKKGGGFRSLTDVIKQTQARIMRSTKDTLLEAPGCAHAQRLAEFYGLDNKTGGFMSYKRQADAVQASGGGFTPAAPRTPQRGKTPRARKTRQVSASSAYSRSNSPARRSYDNFQSRAFAQHQAAQPMEQPAVSRTQRAVSAPPVRPAPQARPATIPENVEEPPYARPNLNTIPSRDSNPSAGVLATTAPDSIWGPSTSENNSREPGYQISSPARPRPTSPVPPLPLHRLSRPSPRAGSDDFSVQTGGGGREYVFRPDPPQRRLENP